MLPVPLASQLCACGFDLHGAQISACTAHPSAHAHPWPHPTSSARRVLPITAPTRACTQPPAAALPPLRLLRIVCCCCCLSRYCCLLPLVPQPIVARCRAPLLPPLPPLPPPVVPGRARLRLPLLCCSVGCCSLHYCCSACIAEATVTFSYCSAS